MNRVKIGLRGKNGMGKMEMATSIVKGLNRVAGMAESKALQAELNAAIVAFAEANDQAQFGDRRAIQTRKLCEQNLELAIRNAALVAERWSLGETELLAAIGFETRKANNTPTPLTPPDQLRAKRTETSGELKLLWKPVANSRNYLVQIAKAEGKGRLNWQTAHYSTRSRCSLQLTAGKIYRIRIIALGASGLSQPSQNIEIMAA